MSLGGGSNESSSESSSRVSTPEELAAHFAKLNQLSGGKVGTWAQEGTAPTYYNQLTEQQLKNIGGAGETRRQAINTNLTNQMDQINTNPSMTYAQQQRATQLANESARSQLDAVNKETEAAMTGLASQEQMRQYQAALANAGLTQKDLALLGQLYYGGKGNVSSSSSSSSGWNVSMGAKKQ